MMYFFYRLILEIVKIFLFLSNWEVYLYEINRKLMLFLIIFIDKLNDNIVIIKVKYILFCIL